MEEIRVTVSLPDVSEEDRLLLDKIKKAASGTTDAVVKREKDGKLNVYKNKITKVS